MRLFLHVIEGTLQIFASAAILDHIHNSGYVLF
jgi:hypothetical protein